MSASLRIRRTANFDGVAAGSTARYDFPRGRRYHGIWLEIGTLADIEDIVVKVNGVDIHRYDSADLEALNKYHGLTAAGATSSLLYVPFEEIGYADPKVGELYSINTGVADSQGVVINTLAIECTIASGASSPTLSGRTVSSFNDPMIGEREHMILFRRRYTYSGLITGENEIDKLPYGSSRELFFRRATFKPSASSLTSFKVEKNGETIDDLSVALNTRLQADGDVRMKKVAQAGYVVYDRGERGRLANDLALNDANDWRFKLTAAGAMSVTVFYETVGRVQG